MLVFAGIKNSVVALDAETGFKVWHTELRSSDFVSVLWDGKALFATNSGEIWRLDPTTGTAMWHNEMTGLGRGLISLASSRHPNASDQELTVELMRRAAAQAAAAG